MVSHSHYPVAELKIPGAVSCAGPRLYSMASNLGPGLAEPARERPETPAFTVDGSGSLMDSLTHSVLALLRGPRELPGPSRDADLCRKGLDLELRA
jgi:hypothetical protein